MNFMFSTDARKDSCYLQVWSHIHGKNNFDSHPSDDPHLSVLAFRYRNNKPVIDRNGSYVAWARTVPFSRRDEPSIRELERFLKKKKFTKTQIARLRTTVFPAPEFVKAS